MSLMKWLKKLLNDIDGLSNKQIGIIFAAIGIITFAICLSNPFQGDDITQIVENLPVHFIQNLGAFFTSSTFYNGQDLVGTYYRPLMTTTFSVLYTLFQTWTGGYHIFQIALFAGGSFILFLVLKRFISQRYAFILALIFMVHPMNSQIVFSIACMQDALMFFFGISGLYLVIARRSWRSIIVAAICLLLALFSKESGLGYLIVTCGYLLFFDRKKIWRFAIVMVGPVALYLWLKIIAVGLLVGNANGAPIDHMGLLSRLMTSPSIIQFYFGKFIMPLYLSTCWYWTEPHFTILGVLVPLIVDGLILTLFIYLGVLVKQRRSKHQFLAYLFFAGWAMLGLLPYLQITPLDMTACETWFCFSMIGVLAMIGLALPAIKLRRITIKPEWLLLLAIIIFTAFAIRTIERGSNYSSQYNIAIHDLAVSKNDYSALNNIAKYMIDNGRYQDAEAYVNQSIAIFPGLGNYDNLGVIYQQTARYDQAIDTYKKALEMGSMNFVYENLAQIYLGTWQDPKTETFLHSALTLYPLDYRLLTYMAILKAAQGDNESAKTYIEKALIYGEVPPTLYAAIIKHQPLTFTIPVSKEPITLK
jgi:Tfp pilus assembly protein PilF